MGGREPRAGWMHAEENLEPGRCGGDDGEVTNHTTGLADALRQALGVRPDEGPRTARLFAYLLCASALFILGRTVRDTLFLSRYPIAALPWMFVAYGVASAATVAFYATVADRLPRHRLTALWTALGVGTYLGTWLAVKSGADWIYPVFYVWSEICSNLFLVQFWTLANDLHDAREARRLFGTIGSARVLGVVIVGAITGALVRSVGTEALLFVLAALMIVICALAISLRRERRAERGTSVLERAPGGRTPAVARDAYVHVLSIVLFLAFVSLTVGDYQFKAIARAAYREEELARFFGLFYAGTGILAFLFQLFVTPRLLARGGVAWGMAAMPGLFGGASACLLAFPALPAATVMKFADNGLQYTIHETTLQALYVPFAPQRKARTRAFLDAVVKPLAYAGGGLALLLAAPTWEVHRLSWITLALTTGWLALLPRVRARYLAALHGSLGVPGAMVLGAESAIDADGRRLLHDALERGDPRQARVALEQLGDERSEALGRVVAGLARHPDPALRAAALDRLAGWRGARASVAEAALEDPDEEVRVAAVRTYARLAGEGGIHGLQARLDDPCRRVRTAALSGLLAFGGVSGGILGGTRMSTLLHSAAAVDREEAALALGPLRASSYQPLLDLLRDPDPRVRRAALRSAREAADPRLLPALLPLLRSPATRRGAGEALVAIGSHAIEPLAEILRDPGAPRDLRLIAPRLLREIPDPRSFARLRALVGTEDSHVRLRIFAALSRLRIRLGLPPEPVTWLEPLLRQEMREAVHNRIGWEAVRPGWETPLLKEEFEFRLERSAKRVLRLLELRFPRASLQAVRSCLDDRRFRANALEVLDTVLDAELRPLVMAFFDDRPRGEEPVVLGEPAPELPDAGEFMRLQCRHPNPYVAFVALDAMGRRPDRGPVGAAEALRSLADPEPLVREAALRALISLQSPSVRLALERLDGDPDPVVAALACACRKNPETPHRPEVGMYSTAEKILFLKGASVFARVRGEDLAPMARMAEAEYFGPNHVVFREGEMGDSLYVIVSGRVTIESGGRTLAALGPGEAFGEMAVLDAEPRSATAQTQAETEVLRIGSEEFYGVLREQGEIAEGVIRMLTHRLRESTARP